MFFKNILLYRLTESFDYSAKDFNELLQAKAFFPCSRSENSSMGWVSPYGLNDDIFVHSLKSYLLFAFCKEQKLLPAGVVRDELNKKIKDLEEREGREIYRNEKIQLKEETIINLRYQAFSRRKIILAYIDINNNWLIVDAASRNKAEDVCLLLRKSLGSLKVVLPQTVSKPEAIMTTWLRERQELSNFNIENNCDMLDPKQKASMIKCKEQDLSSDEIVRHLHTGKQVVKLALNWENKIAFEMQDDLSIRKIRFLDLLKKQKEEVKTDSQQQQLDADFAMMTGEFSQFLTSLWTLFNGLTPRIDL